MRTVCIIQARMGSSRLPGKSLRVLAGRPLIAHVIERARCLPVDNVVIATSESERDDPLRDALHQTIRVYRGHETDVLERLYLVAVAERAEVVVRVTGDCPLLPPDVGARVIEHFHTIRARDDLDSCSLDYCWNDTARSGYPDGSDIEVMTRQALGDAFRLARTPSDREHVTPWIRARRAMATVVNATADWSRLKLSVDTQDDLDRVQTIMSALPPSALTLADTILAAQRTGIV